MSYYDDCDDDDDDEYSSEDEIFYHNYSVDYANQILGGHHAISSCLPLMRRKYRRHYSPQLMRVATLDQMPIVNRHQMLPSLRSRPKFGNGEDIPSQIPMAPPAPLPSLEATSEELERRATRTTQPIFETSNNTSSLSTNNNPTSDNTHRTMTEAELRQVQQQQEAFQQHLLNMQRHLMEQTQQQQEQQLPTSIPSTSLPSTSRSFEKRTKVSYHDLERDDDQAQIAELIENDPYFAAAMEDFAHTHGLLYTHRHRTDSNYSHSSKRYRRPHHREISPRPSSSSSSSSSSMSSLTNVTSDLKGSRTDLILLHELHQIRRLMEEHLRARNNLVNTNQPTISIMPVPWPMTAGQYPPVPGVHYPPVAPVTDYQPSTVPPQRVPPPEPNRVLYQNVVNSVKEVMDQRPPSQRDQPLKPSEIDPKLKYVYARRPRIQPASMQRPPLPPPQQQQRRRRSSQMSTPPMVSSIPPSQQQQQRRRRSSQMSTPSMLSQIRPQPTPPSTNIPPAPPYEPLANFTSTRSTTNKDRNLSYGNRQKESNIYDTLQLVHSPRLLTKIYN